MNPCRQLERLTGFSVATLVHRGGLRADILADGEIAVGDSISITDVSAALVDTDEPEERLAAGVEETERRCPVFKPATRVGLHSGANSRADTSLAATR